MWYDKISKDSDIVISSRIRYARNISGYKFPHLLNKGELKKIVEIVSNNADKNNFNTLNMKDIDSITQKSLKEKHLISKEFVGNDFGAIITNKDNSLVCMINEEDHLRIQAFEAGFDIDSCYEKLVEFTNVLGSKVKFMKNDKYGYLTSCPTNVGSGMRVSLMLHLPALKKTGTLYNILEQVNNIGFSVRGIYGENSEAIGNIYQISNRKTLGMSDKEIIDNLKLVITYIIEAERKARSAIKENITFQDCVYRAYGILKNSRIISNEEAMKLLSDLRLGVSIDIIKEIELSKVQSLIVETQENTLKLILKDNFDTQEENIKRADYIRKELV